ncbi:uncharacterized protein [Watersipora subatra]|uniref:uncharacterized protein n=1 Tax=Watersipora subatra TaxID=2589382 RepID=UPI00355C2227
MEMGYRMASESGLPCIFTNTGVAGNSASNLCPSSAVFNYQYHSWNEALDTTFNTTDESQLVKAVMYDKLASDTSLRIKYSALLGVKVTVTNQKYCGRWYIAINGTECTPKADIIISHDASNAKTYWEHHVRVYSLEGICDNELESGQHSIEIYMGKCYWNKTEPTNFVVNSHSCPSRLHIEEVRKEKKIDGVYTKNHSVFRSLTGYLTRYHYYNLDDDTDNGIILTVTYLKQYEDTALKLTASGTHSTDIAAKCAKW